MRREGGPREGPFLLVRWRRSSLEGGSAEAWPERLGWADIHGLGKVVVAESTKLFSVPSLVALAKLARMRYVSSIEFRPNDLASSHTTRRTDDLNQNLEHKPGCTTVRPA